MRPDSILEKIGRTRLESLGQYGQISLYAKIEHENPSGSIKDRAAYRMIKDAESSGELKDGMGIIEVSSGNTGISLAMIGKELGYDVVIVTGNAVTQNAKEMIKSSGAEVVNVNGYFADCFRRLADLMKSESGYFYWPNQTSNRSSLVSNRQLGYEISNELSPDIFIASMGTGSTITGVGRAIKEKNSKTRVYLVLPTIEYDVPGVDDYRDATIDLPLFDRSVIDHEIRVSEEDAIESAKKLHHDYNLPVGVSSGAVFRAAERIQDTEEGTAVMVFPDKSDRYRSLER